MWGAEAQGLAHRGDEFRSAVCWRGCQHSLLPEAHITVLTVQLDPSPSWLLPFLFFILFSDCYQMPAACPALCAQSWLPGDPSVPLRQALDAGLHLLSSSLDALPMSSCQLPLPSCHATVSPKASWSPAGRVCPSSIVLYSGAVGLTLGMQWAWLMALQLCNLSQQCLKCHSQGLALLKYSRSILHDPLAWGS